MYTQCSKCETVFSLSAEVLRAAGGQVRCGKCGEVFNALARLAEESNAFSADESALELEARADSILESLGSPAAEQEAVADVEEFAPPGVEIARIEILDWPEDNPAQAPEEDRSLEFTLPPGELDRIFVESKKRTAPLIPPPTPPAPTPPSTQQAAPQRAADAAPHPESVQADLAPAHNRVTGFEVPEDVRREMLAGFEPRVEPAFELGVGPSAAAPRRPLLVWSSAAIAAALLLSAQIVQQNREWFVAGTRGPFGGAVRTLYGAIGSPLPAPSNLSAYQLRQWGVTGDPDANGTLRLRASILNAAAQVQPYPLLRVTLADRFGKSIGRRDFEPGEYMGKPPARQLAGGERVDATLEILDPGKSAEGFEIDVCLRGADHRVVCANDVAPQAPQ